MSKFKQYLISEGRGKNISGREAVENIKRNCNKTLGLYKKGGNVILRGVNDSGTYSLVDPSKGEPRMSANTFNYYTLMMDNLDSWKEYPKRSKSIICEINEFKNCNVISGYGKPHIVFPFDKCKIGVCSDIDLWYSFPEVGSLYDFNEAIHSLLKRFSTPNIKYQKNWKLLINFLESLHIEDFIEVWNYSNLADIVVKSRWGSIEDFLNKVMNPESNGFKLIKPGNNLTHSVSECWVGDGPSILIAIDEKYINNVYDFNDFWYEDVLENI